MTTAYTPILQLALPVTGELNGTWGTVVNDNITSMVEQAIAGLATINTWTTASHTLTTADGTTDEARCAVLECSGAPGAAATVVCPARTKLFVIKNSVTGGYAVTLKTSAGTGISVPNGSTALLYCDGTNVVSGATYMATVSTTQVDILAQGDLRLQDTTGGEYVALQAPATLSSSYTLTMPADDGTANQVLITDGSGVLSWLTLTANNVSYTPAGTGAVATTVQTKLQESVNVKDFGAVGNGVANDTTAIQAAIDAVGVAGGGVVNFTAGTFLISAGLLDRGKTIMLCGVGSNEDPTNSGLVTIIQTTGAINGWTVTGNRSGAKNLTVKGSGGAFNANASGFVINGSKSIIENCSAISNRGHGFSYTYGNQSYFSNILSLSNSGHGLYIGDAVGSVDDNASYFGNVDVRANLKSGVYADTSISFANNFYNLVAQGNSEWGFFCNATYYNVYGFYAEANTLGSICFGAASSNNRVSGVLTAVFPPATDLSTSQKNYVQGYSAADLFYNCIYLDIGDKNGPLGGYLRLSDNGTNYALQLLGSNESLIMPIESLGTGKLTIKPQEIYLEPPIAPTLLNSWVNFGGSKTVAGYYRDAFKIVNLQGTIKSGTTASPTTLFNLPVEYRPPNRVQFPVRSNGTFGSVFIDSDGNVYFDTGSNVEFSLDGIYFRTI